LRSLIPDEIIKIRKNASVMNKIIITSFGRMAGGLTSRTQPPPGCDVNRESGTETANGGWLQ
jgi:hypothetical protein